MRLTWFKSPTAACKVPSRSMAIYKVKEHSGQIRLVAYPEISVFRAGLAFIEKAILNLKKLIEYLNNIVFNYFIDNQHFTI